MRTLRETFVAIQININAKNRNDENDENDVLRNV